MVHESLARKFHPAGFEQPEDSRRNYVKPRPELQYAFDMWINELPLLFTCSDMGKQYKKACDLVRPIGEITYKEANSLLVDFKPKTGDQKTVGLFLSACYNISSEQVIIFDLDVPEVDFVGGLGENKILVNNGEAGEYFGSDCSGLVVNNKKTRGWFAAGRLGVIVDNGETGWNFTDYSSRTAIALSPGAKTICPCDIDRIPELKKYMKELRDLTMAIKDEESAKRFIERYGVGGERIEPEILRIIEAT